MARISTHVLDIEKGRPAEGIPVRLYCGGALVGSAVTNADGRTDEPLLAGEALELGVYELRFEVSAYLESEFFGEIPIRFSVKEAAGNYHVPLLLAGHGYSTYRGS